MEGIRLGGLFMFDQSHFDPDKAILIRLNIQRCVL